VSLPGDSLRNQGPPKSQAVADALDALLAAGSQIYWAATDTGGGANTYVISVSSFVTAYAAGQIFAFPPANSNTGASTLNVNGLGVKNIRKADGSVALEADNLFTSRICFVVYDGTQFQLLGTAQPGKNSDIYQLLSTAGIKILAGGSTSTAKLGGAVFDHYADAGNSGTSETDLYSDTLPAGLLGTNGDKLEVFYAGTFVSSGTATRQLLLKWAGTAILDTGALTVSLSSAWTLWGQIIRESSSIIRCACSLTTEGAALAAYTQYTRITGLTLSNTQVLKITGTATGVGAATNDIVAKQASLSWFGAA
jgi:hypothetical protein